MDILSKHFSAEVTGLGGRKTKIRFSGKEALLHIAYAEAMAPVITTFTETYKSGIKNEEYLCAPTSEGLVAQVLRLSVDIDTPSKLSTRGVQALTALTNARDKNIQQIFEDVARANPRPGSDLHMQACLTLQQEEQWLEESRQILGFFCQLQAQQD